MKINTFKKFIASLGVAVLVTSNIGSALTPLTIYAAEDNSEGESSADVSEAEPAAEENSEPEEAEPASVEESEPEESNEGAYSDDAGSGNEGDQESSEENADEAGSEDPSGEEAAEDTVPEESDEIDTSDESASLDASLDEEAELNDSVNTEEGQKKEKRSLTVKVKAVKKSGGSIIDGNEEEINFDDDDIIDLTKDTDDFSTEIEIGGCKYTYVDAAYKDDVITAIKTNIKSETDSEIITETKFTSDKEFKNFTEDSSWTECFDESDIKDHKAVITLNYSKVEVPVIKEEPAEKVTEETTEAATVESTEEAEETKKTEEAGKDNSESKEESSEASSTDKTEDKKEDTSNIEETVSHKFYGEAIADGTAISDKAFELTVEGAADVAELAPEYDGYSFVEAQYDGTVITAIDKDAVEANGTWTEISKDVTDVTVSFYYEAVEDTTEETDKETADDKKTEADEKTYEITASFKENKKDKVFTFAPVDGSDTVVLDLTEEQVSIEDISDQYYTGTLKLTDAWIGLCKITSVSKYGYIKLNGDGEVVPFTSDTNIIFHYDEEESTLISGLDKVFGNLLLPKTAEGSLSFNEFDLDNNTVYWSILVDKTEDAKWPISDVVITEAEMKYGYGVDAELVNDMSVVWDDLKVTSEGKTISDESYSVDRENNTVTFEVLDRPVEIIVAAKLSESDTIEADEKFTAVNKVELTADGKDSDEYTATAEYEAEADESEDESDGVVLDATLVDIFGEPISEEYTNIELPEFNEDGILVLDDADNAPVKDVVVGDEEQGIKKYVYVEASLNDEVITAIKKEVVEADEAAETEESVDEEIADTEEEAPAEKIAFFYTTDGENWISIEEDSTVELTYSCEKQSLYVYEDDNVKITVAVPEETVLPNDTQLEVLPILKGTPEYKEVTAAFDNADAAKTEADAEAVEEENKKVEYLYDISFVKEDEEIEPEGEVAVSFEFKHAKIDGEGKPEECEVTVDHLLDDGTVENLDADSKINNKGELKQVDVVTESFSVFRVLAARTAQSTTDTIPEAAYSLEYLLNHYQAVALEGDLVLNIHCMGPVLVKGGLSGGGSGFGDSAYTDVSSYIGGYVSYHGPSNSRQETAPHNLYVGTSNTVTDNNTDLNGMADFNKGIRGSDVPGKIYTTDNYVDWARMSGVVSGTVNSIQGLAKNSYEGQWDWQEISVPAGSVVDLKTNGKKIKINIIGNSDKTTVINVTDGGNNVLVPMIANVQATEDNRNAPPIAFTFPNATGVKVVADLTPQSGHVIAPNAKITVEGGNYNGCLVGKSIVSNGEGHLWPYRGGSLVPATAGLNVTKTVDGKTPDTNNFKFTVSELKNGAWKVIDTKNNNGSDVKFSSITYKEAGEHWYLIQEDQTPVQGYILSADKYLLKVSVSAGQSGSLDVTLSSNVTIYKAKDGVSADALISGGTVDQSKISQLNVSSGQTSADVIKFNNTKPGSLKLVKNFTGAELADELKNSVSFTVTGPEGFKTVTTYADFTDGKYVLENLKPGTYTVVETNANVDGYARKTTIDGVGEDNSITVAAGQTATATYTNTYTKGTKAVIEGTKTLTVPEGSSKTLAAGAFTFELTGDGIKEPITTTNDANGNIKFAEFSYSKAGSYHYTIKEVVPSDSDKEAGITYDTKTVSVVVTVTENETTHEFEANVIYDGSTTVPTFSNTYTPAGTDIALEATKSLTGKKLEAGQFTFTLTGSGQDQSKTNDADGKVAFDKISYTKAGTYTYTIKETAGEAGGITYDGSVYTVTVTVEDDGNGHLTATKTIQKGTENADAVTFENKYETGKVSATLGAKKSLTGRDLAAQEFTFELSAVTDKAPMPETATAQNDGTGNVTFGEIEYSAAGTYEYKIKETKGSLGGVTYDEAEHTAKVVVTDNGNGTLSAAVTYDGEGTTAPIFNNTYTPLTVTIRKTDVAGKELAGAELKLEDEKGNVVETWTSDGKAKEIELQPGKYTLTETSAPKGYEVSESITFTVALDSEGNAVVTVDGDEVDAVVMVDDYSDQTVTISKVDAGGKEIEGAEIEVTDKDGNTVDKWTSEEGKSHKITVKPGEYTFKEVNAPEGYEAVTEIKFTVDKDGTVTVTSTETNAAKVDEDGKLVITDELTDRKVKFSKTDIAGDELAGATIVVTGTDAAGQKVEKTWVSDGKAHELELPMGSYTMTETAAPNGYVIATAIDFTVNANGTITVGKITTESEDKNIVTMVDGYVDQTVTISKVDMGGNEIGGAEIKITTEDKDGNEVVVDEWKSEEGKNHDITVKPGEYTFHEVNAPKGYVTVTEFKFIVALDSDGNAVVTVEGTDAAEVDGNGALVVTDKAINFTVNKTELGNGEEVEGATIEVVDENGKVVDSWTSKKGETHDFGPKLEAGKSYTLKETVAPEGYNYVTDIEFSVGEDGSITAKMPTTTDEDGNVTYLVEDSKLHFTVNKTELGNGEEVEGATIEVIDENGKVVDSWTSKKGETHDFGPKLEAGKSYTLKETVAPEGYNYVTDIKFSVGEDGSITAKMPTTTDEDGNVTYLVEDSKLHFNVNKTELGNGEEVEGATIEVVDEDGKVVDSWTSKKGETHDFGPKLEAGKSYTLKETVAPEGYNYVTDIEFSVGEDGSITAKMPTTTDEDGNVTYLVEDSKLHFTVNKTELGNGEEVEGATIEVVDENGKVVDSWTSKKGETHDFGPKLEAGKSYTLKETVAPEGYNYVTDIEFSVGEDGSITAKMPTTTDEDGNVTYLVEDSKLHFNVNKTELGNGEEVEGATIEVVDENGKVVDSWTSKKGETHDFGPKLEAGKSYTLKETVAPEGYNYVTDIEFSVGEDGSITAKMPTTTDEDGNVTYLVEDSKLHFNVNKTELGNGEEVEGATIEVVDENGKVVDSWTSKKGETHDFGPKLEAGKSYTLKETVAPEGYNYVTDIKFSVGEDGSITAKMPTTTDEDGNVTYLVEDSKLHFNVNKTELGNGEEVEGATIEVVDENGKVVDSWTSKKGETHDFGPKLEAGKSYTLKETVAPEGYNYVTDIEFSVGEDGSITAKMPTTTDEDGNVTYLVEDSKLHFNVNKTELGNGEEVEGATIEVVDENGKVVDSWTSKKGETHDFGPKLEAGKSYTLKETVAPEGYNYVTDIEFSVGEDGSITAKMPTTTDEDGNVTYLVEDSKLHFTVNKTELGNGEEVEGATIEVVDEGGKVVDSWTSKKGETHDFGPKLEAGKSYTLKETVAPEGYNYVTDIKFSVGEDGSITADMPKATDEDGNVTYLVEDERRPVTEIPVIKIWRDNNNADEIRPSQIRVHLYADGKEIDSATITNSKGWKHTFKNLYVKTLDGNKIVYTITEEKVNGYETVIRNNTIGGFNITNTHKPTTPPGGEGGDGGGEGGGEGGGHGEQTPPTTPPSPPREVTPETPSVPRNIRLGVPSVPKNMKTGDDGQMPVYGGLSIASLGALLIWIRKRRKKSA